MLMNTELKIDALLPSEMALRAETVGVRKAELAFLPMFALAVLAGAFIALGAIFSTTLIAGAGSAGITAADGSLVYRSALPFGIQRLLAGLAFCLGLILVVVAGAELFTGNNLIVMAWANKKVSTRMLLRNWVIVYLGNFAGSLGTAGMIYLSGHYKYGGGAIGTAALSIANAKTSLEFVPALFLGVLCNALVCLAVWMTYSARSTTDKILSIIFPITAFVAAGFEHSVANMYFIPIGLFIKYLDPAFTARLVESAGLNLEKLTWGNFLNNLVPVTLGNIIGGAGLVALVYWLVHLRQAK
jgi:formate/nitrite transporter